MVLRSSTVGLLLLTLGVPAFAQTAAPTQTSSPQARAENHSARVQRRGTPCWRQAGMTPDMVNQRWYIEDQQKLRVAQVCSEPSTSAQQKHDKIEQIHADTDHAIAQLIPTQELAAFNKCQAEVDQRNPKPVGQKQLGPCGGIIPDAMSADATTASEHRHAATPNKH